MKNLRFAILASTLVLAGAARASPLDSGFMNQEGQREAAARVHTTPAYVDLTTSNGARLDSGFRTQEEARVAAARVHTTPAYVDLTRCPSSHEAAHDQIAQRELQVPDRDRGKIVSSTNCCVMTDRMASAR